MSVHLSALPFKEFVKRFECLFNQLGQMACTFTRGLNKLIHAIEINNYQLEQLSLSFLVYLWADDSFIDENLARQANLDLAKLTEP